MNPANEKSEPTDASPRLAVLIAASAALGVGLALLAAWALIAHGSPRVPPLGKIALFSHGPEARTAIAEDWRKLSEETRDHLSSYGWVDRPHGVVRIPIEQAMTLLAAAPPRPQPAGERKSP